MYTIELTTNIVTVTGYPKGGDDHVFFTETRQRFAKESFPRITETKKLEYNTRGSHNGF